MAFVFLIIFLLFQSKIPEEILDNNSNRRSEDQWNNWVFLNPFSDILNGLLISLFFLLFSFFFFFFLYLWKQKEIAQKIPKPKHFHLDAFSASFLHISKRFSNKDDGHQASLAQTASCPNKCMLPATLHENFTPQRQKGLCKPIRGNMPELTVRGTPLA